MKPGLTKYYVDKLQEEGCKVTQEEDGQINFEFAQQNFCLWALSELRYLVLHSLIMPNGIGPQDYPRILDAVNQSNMFYGVQTKAFRAGDTIVVTISANGETEPALGLYALRTMISDLLEAAGELFTNISNHNFAWVLKKDSGEQTTNNSITIPCAP